MWIRHMSNENIQSMRHLIWLLPKNWWYMDITGYITYIIKVTSLNHRLLLLQISFVFFNKIYWNYFEILKCILGWVVLVDPELSEKRFIPQTKSGTWLKENDERGPERSTYPPWTEWSVYFLDCWLKLAYHHSWYCYWIFFLQSYNMLV